MNRLALAVVVLFGSSVFAQEIGNEIPNNNNGAKSSPDSYSNPYNGTNGSSTVPPPPPPPSASNLAAPHGSAGRGSIGLSAYFGGSAAAPISASTGSGASATVAGPVGLSTMSLAFFVADVLRITVDAGFGMAFSGQTPLGFELGAGVDIVLKGPDSPVRPFITIKASFAKAISTGDNFGLNPAVGFGGEYYLSPNFALSVRALVAMPILLSGQGNVFLVAFSPSVGATVYF